MEMTRKLRNRLLPAAILAMALISMPMPAHAASKEMIELQTKSATFFPQAANVIDNSAPQVLATDGEGFHLTLKVSDQAPGQPVQLKGVLVVGARAYQITAPVVSK